MTSVRMLAAGAVALFVLPVLTAPVSACDDRYIQKCESEAEAAFQAENGPPTAIAPKRKTMRVRAAPAGQAEARPRHAPRFAVKHAPPPAAAPPAEEAPAADDKAAPERPEVEHAAALPESPMMRRFRGFIDPQPMAVNSFEELRRPRLAAEHLKAEPAIPSNEMSSAAPRDASHDEVADAGPAAPPAKVAEAAQPAAPPAAAPAPVLAQNVPADQPGGFPFHKLILTMCAALGVASALRFIVRA
jgi:ribonuclease E